MKSAAVSLFALFALAAIASAQDTNAERGAEAFIATCAECHSSPERLVRRMPRDPADRQTALENLLADHHALDEAMRRDIISYLGSL